MRNMPVSSMHNLSWNCNRITDLDVGNSDLFRAIAHSLILAAMVLIEAVLSTGCHSAEIAGPCKPTICFAELQLPVPIRELPPYCHTETFRRSLQLKKGDNTTSFLSHTAISVQVWSDIADSVGIYEIGPPPNQETVVHWRTLSRIVSIVGVAPQQLMLNDQDLPLIGRIVVFFRNKTESHKEVVYWCSILRSVETDFVKELESPRGRHVAIADSGAVIDSESWLIECVSQRWNERATEWELSTPPRPIYVEASCRVLEAKKDRWVWFGLLRTQSESIKQMLLNRVLDNFEQGAIRKEEGTIMDYSTPGIVALLNLGSYMDKDTEKVLKLIADDETSGNTIRHAAIVALQLVSDDKSTTPPWFQSLLSVHGNKENDLAWISAFPYCSWAIFNVPVKRYEAMFTKWTLAPSE